MRRRRLLGEEQVLEPAVEHVRRAARRLDVDHLRALRDRRGGDVEERRERAEQEVDLVLVDQRVVVGDDEVLVGLVVLDDHLDRAPEQAAGVVDHLHPDLVAAPGGLARLGEVAGQGKGRADANRVAAGLPAAVGRGRIRAAAIALIVVVAAAPGREHQRQQHRQQREEPNDPSHLRHLRCRGYRFPRQPARGAATPPPPRAPPLRRHGSRSRTRSAGPLRRR